MVEGNTTYLPLLVVHAVSLKLRQAQIRAAHLLTFARLLFFQQTRCLGKAKKKSKAPTGSQRCSARTKLDPSGGVPSGTIPGLCQFRRSLFIGKAWKSALHTALHHSLHYLSCSFGRLSCLLHTLASSLVAVEFACGSDKGAPAQVGAAGAAATWRGSRRSDLSSLLATPLNQVLYKSFRRGAGWRTPIRTAAFPPSC